MPCYGNGGEGAYLGEETLGLDEGGAWEACPPGQSPLLKSPVQTGQRIANRCADSHPVCCPMSAIVWALRWAVGWGGKPN